MFFNKQKSVEQMIGRYLEEVNACLDYLVDFIRHSVGDVDHQALGKIAAKVHQSESKADDIRREIELLLYGKALFPESRGDILGLLETVDKIPNCCESLAKNIYCQRNYIPAEFGDDVCDLADHSTNCARHLLRAVATLFDDYNTAMHLAEQVDQLESRGDDVERALIERLFATDRDTAQKILLRDIIQKLGDLADLAENVGDRIRIIAVKRKI